MAIVHTTDPIFHPSNSPPEVVAVLSFPETTVTAYSITGTTGEALIDGQTLTFRQPGITLGNGIAVSLGFYGLEDATTTAFYRTLGGLTTSTTVALPTSVSSNTSVRTNGTTVVVTSTGSGSSSSSMSASLTTSGPVTSSSASTTTEESTATGQTQTQSASSSSSSSAGNDAITISPSKVIIIGLAGVAVLASCL